MQDESELLNPEEYEDFVEECRDIVTEAVFHSRWDLIEGYHLLGETIIKHKNFGKFVKGNKRFVQDLAQNIGIKERTLYYAIQFYEKYPRLEEVPEGKNISWNKIVTKYLPETPKEEKKPKVTTCPNCGHSWS